MTSSAPLNRLHNSPGCSWQSCESGELNDVMRWHLLVLELSAALQPPFFAEGPAQRLTSFSWSRTKKKQKKTGTTKIPPTLKLTRVWKRMGKTDGSGYRQLFGVVERQGWDWSVSARQRTRGSTIRELWTQEFQNPPREMPSRTSLWRFKPVCVAMPETGY